MRVAGRTGYVFGLLLLTAAVSIAAGDALAASSFGGRSAGGLRAATPMHRHPGARRFPGAGIVAVDGASDPPVVIIQNNAPAPAAAERAESPPVSKTYVQPRWVDGGHGVQILAPGRWVETKPAANR